MSLSMFAFFKCLEFLSVSVAVCVYPCCVMTRVLVSEQKINFSN